MKFRPLTIAVVFTAASLFTFISGGAWKMRASYTFWKPITLFRGGAFCLPIATPQFSDQTTSGGVDVIKEEVVGKLDAKVVSIRLRWQRCANTSRPAASAWYSRWPEAFGIRKAGGIRLAVGFSR